MYFQGGRILPNGQNLQDSDAQLLTQIPIVAKPKTVEELLEILVKGLRRAMHPLTHRRKDLINLSFSSEYDIQDLLHALLRPWIADIRPEEFTPGYAGSSTRMDFLQPNHSLVIETKLVRDKAHSKRIGDELIIDTDHYRVHPDCADLWCVIYDPDCYIQNADGLRNDLEGESRNAKGTLRTRLFII